MRTLDDLAATPSSGPHPPDPSGHYAPGGNGHRLSEPPAGNAPTARLRLARHRRRRRLLVLPLALALLVVSLKLLSMSWWSRQGASAYDDARYSASRSAFEHTRAANVIDPWKAWLGIGDARFRMNDLAGAEDAFSRALAADPARCDVRFNLAIAIETRGDQLVGNDAREVTDQERLDGVSRYRVALDIINAGICPVGEPDGPGERLADSRERLEAKLGADGSPQNESAMDDPEQDTEDGDQNETDTQQDAIQDRNETGAAERQDASDINPAEQQPPREPNW